MGIKDHTLGETRYITYELLFPDGDRWCDQTPFWGPLHTFLKLTTFAKKPALCRDLIVKGETHWRDQNRVVHRIKVENIERPYKWGKETERKKS